jgi:multimeric flavodoxin WrbA
MKVLILNGSPRRHGNMSKMLELMKQELEGCGAETVYITFRGCRYIPASVA